MSRPKDILSTGEFGREVGVDAATAYRWCELAHSGGESPLSSDECWKAGSHWRITLAAARRIRAGLPIGSDDTASIAAEPTPEYTVDQTQKGHSDNAE